MLRFNLRKQVVREFTAVFEKRGRWYVAYVKEIPGVNKQGRTIAEARRNLREALHLILGTNHLLAAEQSPRGARREPMAVEL